MKRSKILLAFFIVIIMLLVVGCQEQMIDGQVVRGNYTWLREGETLEEGGLRFSTDEINYLVISTRSNNVTIGTHNGNDIVIEYVPDAPGSGRYYHHIIRPRYVYANNHLEIFRDVNLATNTFIRSGTIKITVPIYDGLMFEDISITTASGDIRFDNFNANNIIISTSSGSIRLANLNANSATVNTTINSIDVTNVDIEGNLVLQTTHENIDISYSRVRGILSATTTFADIIITNVDTDIDNADLNTSHGGIIIN